MYPLLADRVELRPRLRDFFRGRLIGNPEDALATLEVRSAVHAPVRERGVGIGPERSSDLVSRPDEELPFFALGVGVLRRVEATGGVTHLSQQVIERLFADLTVFGVAERLPAVEVERRELSVVVEHLLEVGYQPVGVHRVAMESAAELVVHAASGHLRERLADHAAREFVPCPLPEAQHELPDHRLGKLGCAAEATFGLVATAPGAP